MTASPYPCAVKTVRIAAATSYSVNDTPMIPFYIYYSMFGFQRTGDLCWAAGDSRARGFLLGATAGFDLLAATPDADALLVTADSAVRTTPGFPPIEETPYDS